MNEHSLAVLEFDHFLDLVSAYAVSEPGREQVRGIQPRETEAEIDGSRRLYADALALRRKDVALPPARFISPDEALARAAPDDAVLDEETLLAVREVLEAARGLRQFLSEERCLDSPALQELAHRIEPCVDLCRAIDAVFKDREPKVLDTASERLHGIRRAMEALERQIQAQLERMLRDPAVAEALQEDFITTRHGRSVLPVRRELRSRLKGIVHDQSNSGGTLFVEPEAVVEPANQLEVLRLDERDEVRRILGALTDTVRGEIPAIRTDADLLCLYDMAYAVSAWARDQNCIFAPIGDRLRLIAARHPLLLHRLAQDGRSESLVPLDLELPDDRNVVVITGSNTGGKTVALKTAGLLTLLTQAGLPIPAAEGTEIRFFHDVLADIGDEQSIEQSLSTFGAHLERVVATLAAARTAPTLVLLDELGAGTDPVEGGALACAILDALSGTDGLTVATTHLGAVKRFVHVHPRTTNAAMRFNVETLRPQYRLVMGQAGASYALTIAERFGLPAEILATARGMLSEGDLRLESLLHALDAKHIRMDRDRQDLERLRDEALQDRDRAKRDYERVSLELESVRSQRKSVIRDAQNQAATLVDGTRREVENILSEARRQPDRDKARGLRQRIETRAQELTTALEQNRGTPLRPFSQGELKVGDRVWVEFVKDHGTVAALADDGRRATVEIGRVRFDLARQDLGRPRPGATAPAPPSEPKGRVQDSVKRRAVPTELNLVGQRVEEAVAHLASYLDAAMLASLPQVRIVHGYGTGALRKAVHTCLAKAGVESFRLGVETEDPGGAGVTIVTL